MMRLPEDVDRDKSQALGLLAHKMMEAVGNGCKLEEVLDSKNLKCPPDKIGIEQADVEEVCRLLESAKRTIPS